MTDTTAKGATASGDPQKAAVPAKHLDDSNGRYQLTTLGDLGALLPVGIEVNGALEKGLACRPWRFKEEKELGAYREANKGLTLGGYVTHLLGMMMTQIGPHKFTEATAEAERNLTVNQLYLADVLYAYTWLRKQCLGKDLDTVLRCPVCEMANERVLNLDGLDVATVSDPGVLVVEVELYDGVVIFGELRKRLKMRPPTWMVMQNPGMFTDNMAIRTALLINECIVGAEGISGSHPVVIAENDMDEMSKRDFELLSDVIEDSPGPRMAIELGCSRCRTVSLQMVNWQFDSFFSSASKSRVGST